MNLLRAFRAGFVQRWHTNPELSRTNDRVDGHSGRVARIILMLHPDPSVSLLRAALIHDDGECAVGDMKAPFKGKYPVIADALEELEYIERSEIWGGSTDHPMQNDGRWLKFADRLDAYMWAKHHAPYVMDSDGWPEAWAWLRKEGEALGAEAGLDDVCFMRGVKNATA